MAEHDSVPTPRPDEETTEEAAQKDSEKSPSSFQINNEPLTPEQQRMKQWLDTLLPDKPPAKQE